MYTTTIFASRRSRNCSSCSLIYYDTGMSPFLELLEALCHSDTPRHDRPRPPTSTALGAVPRSCRDRRNFSPLKFAPESARFCVDALSKVSKFATCHEMHCAEAILTGMRTDPHMLMFLTTLPTACFYRRPCQGNQT